MSQEMNIKRKRKLLSPQVGDLLVAEPYASDRYFSRSLVVLLQNDEDGMMGLVVNKPVEVQMSELVDLSGFNAYPVSLGGPVGKDRLFYLHNMAFVDGARLVSDGLFFGGDLEQIRQQVELPGNKVRFFVGYAGWEKGQLEAELKTEYWVVVKSEIDVLQERLDSEVWKDVLLSLDDDYYILWANTPVSPLNN